MNGRDFAFLTCQHDIKIRVRVNQDIAKKIKRRQINNIKAAYTISGGKHIKPSNLNNQGLPQVA